MEAAGWFAHRGYELEVLNAYEHRCKTVRFQGHFPKPAELSREAEEVLSYTAFPSAHCYCCQVKPNNSLENVKKEVKRRTEVVSIFPDEAAVIRLVETVLRKQHEEWQRLPEATSAPSLWRS